MAGEPYLDVILDAISASGRSEREVSRAATGQATAIAMIKTGRKPSAERVRQLCETLGLEFYIGPARGRVEHLHTQGKPRAENLIFAAAPMTEIERGTQQLVKAVLDAGGNPFPPSLQDKAVMTLVAANADEAPPGARPVDVVEYAAAAGGGAVGDSEEVRGLLWFSRDWLDRNGLDPTQCAVIRVQGESMEPTLPDGCAILFDRNRQKIREHGIYVVRADGGLIVKRARRAGRTAWLLASDHPSFLPEPWPADAETLGEVVWMARTLVSLSEEKDEIANAPPGRGERSYGSSYWDQFDHLRVGFAMADVARRRETITYDNLAARVWSQPPRPDEEELHVLIMLASYSEDFHDRGLLSAVVVNESDGMPGDDFFDLAERRGRDVSNREACWKAELAKVYEEQSKPRETQERTNHD